jgi:hypothetical protein
MNEFILIDGSIHYPKRSVSVSNKGSSIWLPRLAAQTLANRRFVRIVVLEDHVEIWPDCSYVVDGELII